MAKIAQTQSFSKAAIYYDEDSGRWLLEEVNKDGCDTFDFENDVLKKWAGVDGVSITIKREKDYIATGDA